MRPMHFNKCEKEIVLRTYPEIKRAALKFIEKREVQFQGLHFFCKDRVSVAHRILQIV